MDKKMGRPHEGVSHRNADGVDVDANTEPTDTEGHQAPDSLLPGMPGTGGDFNPRRPSSGGELIDDTDVEGHSISHTGPGTGGDFNPRRPSSGGELIDDNDVEGHSR
jgi:hypothetical protein